jgi:hypothetical protein
MEDWEGGDVPQSAFDGVATQSDHDEEEFAGGLDALDLGGSTTTAAKTAARPATPATRATRQNNASRESRESREPRASHESQAARTPADHDTHGDAAEPQSWIARLWQSISRRFGGT